MNEKVLYRRLARRQCFSSRSVAVIVVLGVVAVACAWVAIECLLAAFGAGPLLLAPSTALAAAKSGLTHASPWAVGAVVLAVVLAIVLLVIAIAPGRLGRHVIPDERLAIVVDDHVLAGALVSSARRSIGIAPDRVGVSVSTRRVEVSLVRTSGLPLDVPAVDLAASRLLEALSVHPRVRLRVRATQSGKVGS